MVRLFIDKQEINFEITKFPDGTSQVWKVDESFAKALFNSQATILWQFENEGEIMHVLQLANLLKEQFNVKRCILSVPYLPYGRQDKVVNNQLSFALKTFKSILRDADLFCIETFDAHSHSDNIYSTDPIEFHRSLPKADVICFPDKGAATRYGTSEAFNNTPTIYCEKVRNQATGEITGLKVVGATQDLLFDKNILIVDDICDGGMTFIKVTEALNEFKPKQVDLAVSHGIFSKGKGVLHEAGIKNIYTTNSLLRNPEGFKVW